MSYTFHFRKVEVTGREWECGEGAWATEAFWEDSGEPLTDSELDEFNDVCGGELYQDAYEHAASRAYDMAKDARLYGSD